MRPVWLFAPLLVACGGPSSPVGPGETTPGTTPEGPDPARQARTVPQYGGTLGVHPSGLVVVADPTRDSVGLSQSTTGLEQVVTFDEGSEPFRVALDDQHAFVTLRGSGQVARIDHAGSDVVLQDVCPEPRGLSVGTDLWVACAGGELVRLDPTSLRVTSTHHLVPDLRDVVVDGTTLLVSRFRTAEVLRLSLPGAELIDTVIPDFAGTLREDASPAVAWRMIEHPAGGAVLLHQSSSNEEIELEDPERPDRGEGAYGGGHVCDDGIFKHKPNGKERGTGPLVQGHITRITRTGDVITGGPLVAVTVPVDIAVNDSGTHYRVAAGLAFKRGATGVFEISSASAESTCGQPDSMIVQDGMVTSVGWHPTSNVVAFDRERGELTGSRLSILDRDWTLNDRVPSQLFHGDPGAGLACASCHPEGQDDGHVWNFADLGPRRTQNLSGGLSNRGSFHWDAEFSSIDELMNDVFVKRMGGHHTDSSENDALIAWLDGIAPVSSTPIASASELQRGQALFEDPTVGCASCHSGPTFSDHQLHAVATGVSPTKTPSLLGVGTRAPFMHTGCADTVLERLTSESCGGDLHGNVRQLPAADVEALAAYVSSL